MLLSPSHHRSVLSEDLLVRFSTYLLGHVFASDSLQLLFGGSLPLPLSLHCRLLVLLIYMLVLHCRSILLALVSF